MKAFQALLPPRTFFGKGSFFRIFEALPLKNRAVLVLTGKSSVLLSRQWQWFKEETGRRGLNLSTYRVSGEPTSELIDKIVAECASKQWDAVIGIGGGSVLDTGKAVSAMLYKLESVHTYLEGFPDSQPHDGSKVFYVACPTTTGTGSEATKNAVIRTTHPARYKRSLRHDRLVPDLAIVDPELSLSCPKDVLIATGLDAFTQLLESYTSSNASTLTDLLALEGLRHCSILVDAVNHLEDLDLKIQMAYAAYLSGITLTNAGLGIVHGLAGILGGMYDAPHGSLCAALLAPAVRKNIRKLEKSGDRDTLRKYEQVGAFFRPSDLCATLGTWQRAFPIKTLRQLNVAKDQFSWIAQQRPNKNNPVPLDPEEILEILEESYG